MKPTRNLVPITVNGWRHHSETDRKHEGFYYNEKKKWYWWNGWIWICGLYTDEPLVRVLNKVSLGYRPALVFIGEPPEEEK